MKKIFGFAVMGLALAGCALSPPYKRPEVETPAAWRGTMGAVSGTEVAADWWRQFGSEELNGLVEKALAQNTDVRAAVQRIEQARAQVRIAGGSMYPSVDASANAGRTLTRRNGDTNGSNSYGVGLDVGYELDLFGRNAAGRQGARASLKASTFDHDALALVTVRDVTKTYFQLLSIRERMALAQVNLSNAEQVLNLLNVRFGAGAISALEVSQQQASVESSRASLASLHAQEAATRDALAVLAGAAAQTFNVQGTAISSLTVPGVFATQPSALLEQRPDIRAAEAQLQAANADVGAARSALFPSIQLGLGDALAFDPARNTIDISAGLLAPIFHGGELRGQLAASKARKQELVEGYRGTVLNAFREVEDALAALRSARLRQDALQIAQAAANRAYELSRLKLDAGAIDMPTLLQAQSAQLQAQDSLVQARLDSLSAVSDASAALGGGWRTK